MPSRTSRDRIDRLLRLSLAAVAIALLVTTATAGPRRLAASQEPGVAVRLEPEHASWLDDASVIRGAAYGGFVWLEMTEAGVALLDGAGIEYERFDDGTQISIGEYRFDPLREEPHPPAHLAAADEDAGANLHLVQLIGPAKDEWLDGLRAAGLDIVQYHAQNSYLVWATPTQLEALAAAPYVRWIGPSHPAYRIAPELLVVGGRAEVTVLAYEGAHFDVQAALNRLGSVIHAVDAPMWNTTYIEALVPAARLVDLAREPGVVAIRGGWRAPGELDEMSDKISAGMINGNYPQSKPPGYEGGFLNEVGLSGDGVTVHINDSGVYEQHNDLYGRMAAEYGNRAAHHGTHVAGIILGEGYNNIGDNSAGGSWIYGLGVAPEAEYVDEYFGCSPSTCTEHAIDNDANVSNNSWGYTTGGAFNYGYGYTANSRTWDGLVQDGDTGTSGPQPLTIVSAAGNGGSGSQTIVDPWEAKNVISVASSRNWRNSTGNQGSGSINDISSYSSRGSCKDGRNCPVVAAPGQYVISARYTTSGCGYQAAPNSSTHSVCSGTSMASPHAAGVVALITEWWRDNNSGDDPSPAMAKALVVNSAIDMGTANIPNTAEGWGRINVAQAVDPDAPTLYWDQETVFDSTGDTWTTDVYPANTSEPLKVTLVWTDAPGPGNGGSSAAWVNDLDLKLQKGGTTWRGNNFYSGWSISGGSVDTKNNVENVYLGSPSSGEYTITITGSSISGDGVLGNSDPTDQNWALVCYNCADDDPGTATPVSTSNVTVTPTLTPGGVEPPTPPFPTATNTPGLMLPTDTPTLPPLPPTPTDTPTLRPTDTSTPLPTDTSTPLPTATDTPLPTATDTPLPTATNTPLPTVTNTPLPTATNTPLPTATYTPLPTATSTPLPTATNTPLPTATDTPLPTATNTPLPTATNTPLPTATFTATFTPTATDTPLPTATDTPLPTATDTPLPTATDTPLPTTTDTPLPTATDTPLPTATDTPLPTATDTPLPTATDTPLPTATDTPLPTATDTPLPTATDTPLPTATFTATYTPTATSTPPAAATNTPPPTATDTPLPTATDTPLPTATDTPLPTATDTPLPTATDTPLPTATNTPLPTATDTPLPTATYTATFTPTATNTPTPWLTIVVPPTATPDQGAPSPTPTPRKRIYSNQELIVGGASLNVPPGQRRQPSATPTPVERPRAHPGPDRWPLHRWQMLRWPMLVGKVEPQPM